MGEAVPVRFLETNIYSAPSDEARELASYERLTAPLDFLLTEARPTLIFAYGGEHRPTVAARASLPEHKCQQYGTTDDGDTEGEPQRVIFKASGSVFPFDSPYWLKRLRLQ